MELITGLRRELKFLLLNSYPAGISQALPTRLPPRVFFSSSSAAAFERKSEKLLSSIFHVDRRVASASRITYATDIYLSPPRLQF